MDMFHDMTLSFMPHGGCYLWTKSLIALHATSDALIVLSYYSIPITLVYFVRRRKDLKFHWMFVCFAIFILACGTTHLMEIWNIWHANYWVSGVIKAITALASVPTAFLLVKLVPKALDLPSPDALQKAYEDLDHRIQERTAELQRATLELQVEIADRKAAEDKLNLLNADLEKRVTQRTAELESFSYTVSHDLRAPLRSISGFAKLVQEEYSAQLPEDARNQLNRIYKNAVNMSQLIDGLLAFSRLGAQPLNKQKISTREIVNQVVEELQGALPHRRVEVTIGSLPDCEADPTLLQQVFANLISNAFKYSQYRNPALVEIGSFAKGGKTVYFVKDNGTGFNMEYAQKLFGVFQRMHSANQFEGTGVGLAIVHRIIHRHGGDIWAEAEADKGAAFFFTLE